MIEPGIQQRVAQDATVQGLIGARFYPVVIPENPTYPCASYQVITNTPDYYLEGGRSIEQIRLQVDTWSGGTTGASYASAKAVQAAIRAVLDQFRGALPGGTQVAGIFVANASDGFLEDGRSFRTTTDYLIHFYPGT